MDELIASDDLLGKPPIEESIRNAQENIESPDAPKTMGVRVSPKLWMKFKYFCKHDLGVRLEKGVEQAFLIYMETAKKEPEKSS